MAIAAAAAAGVDAGPTDDNGQEEDKKSYTGENLREQTDRQRPVR